LAQYAALAECGYFPKKELATLKELGTILQGHPEMLRTAAFYKLDDLVAIFDKNCVQATGG
jgi:transketolase N-terminal domain/subunit